MNSRMKLLEALQDFFMSMPDAEEEKPEAMPALELGEEGKEPKGLKVEMMSVGKADPKELEKLGKMKC